MPFSNRALNKGFTLLEVVVTIVVLSIVTSAVMGVFIGTAQRSADPLIQQQALAIAEAYLEEIQLKAFNDPSLATDSGGAEAGETRATFDDIQDYNDPSIDGAVADQNGVAITELAGYTVTVTVAAGDLGAITQASGDAMRIDVSVNHPAIDPVLLSAFRVNY